jgi:endonuclease-3
MTQLTIKPSEQMTTAQALAFYDALALVIPDPTTELNFNTPFELLTAVLLSAQATDVSVNKATVGLFSAANTPQAMIELGLEGIKSHIKTIGLFNSKAKHLLETCNRLVNQFNSEVPKTREELESLPGVGRKTANVLLNTLWGEPTIAVDTHLFRLGNRTGLAVGKTPLDVEKKLLLITPKKHIKDAHHLLILHGRYVCTARSPQCHSCVVKAYCNWSEKSKTTITGEKI